MDFDLSEEHQLIERTVREWGAREVAPRIRELDRAHRFDPQILPQMAELGLLGCSVPQKTISNTSKEFWNGVSNRSMVWTKRFDGTFIAAQRTCLTTRMFS